MESNTIPNTIPNKTYQHENHFSKPLCIIQQMVDTNKFNGKYPKDFECIIDISKKTRLKILNSKNIIYEISNKLYSIKENRNVFKYNKNYPDIFFINEYGTFDGYMESKIFEIIFERCIEILYEFIYDLRYEIDVNKYLERIFTLKLKDYKIYEKDLYSAVYTQLIINNKDNRINIQDYQRLFLHTNNYKEYINDYIEKYKHKKVKVYNFINPLKQEFNSNINSINNLNIEYLYTIPEFLKT